MLTLGNRSSCTFSSSPEISRRRIASFATEASSPSSVARVYPCPGGRRIHRPAPYKWKSGQIRIKYSEPNSTRHQWSLFSHGSEKCLLPPQCFARRSRGEEAQARGEN